MYILTCCIEPCTISFSKNYTVNFSFHVPLDTGFFLNYTMSIAFPVSSNLVVPKCRRNVLDLAMFSVSGHFQCLTGVNPARETGPSFCQNKKKTYVAYADIINEVIVDPSGLSYKFWVVSVWHVPILFSTFLFFMIDRTN
jgi:hypothetical protein